MNRWKVTDEIKEKFIPILKDYLNKLENLTVEQVETMSNEELGLDFEYPYIFWHIDDMCLYSFIDSKFQACKLIYNNQNDAIMFIDTITGNPIAIENIDKEFSDFMNEFINSIFDNDKGDWDLISFKERAVDGKELIAFR